MCVDRCWEEKRKDLYVSVFLLFLINDFFYTKNFDKCFVKFITEIYSSMRNVTEQSKELKGVRWGGGLHHHTLLWAW